MLTRSDLPVNAGPALDPGCLAAGTSILPIAVAYVPRDHDAGEILAIRQAAAANPALMTAPPIGPTDKIGPTDQALHLGLCALSGRRAQFGAIERSEANGMSSDLDRVAVAHMCDRTCDLLRGQDGDQPRNVLGKPLRRVERKPRDCREAQRRYDASFQGHMIQFNTPIGVHSLFSKRLAYDTVNVKEIVP